MIKSNATPDAYNTPFYQRNKLLAAHFTEYFEMRKGEVKGLYSEASFEFIGRSKDVREIFVRSERAQFSEENIFLSNSFMNLYMKTTWKIVFKELDQLKIELSKQSEFNDLVKGDSSNIELELNTREAVLLNQIIQTLKPMFEEKKVKTFQIAEGILKLTLETDDADFDYLDSLVEL